MAVSRLQFPDCRLHIAVFSILAANCKLLVDLNLNWNVVQDKEFHLKVNLELNIKLNLEPHMKLCGYLKKKVSTITNAEEGQPSSNDPNKLLDTISLTANSGMNKKIRESLSKKSSVSTITNSEEGQPPSNDQEEFLDARTLSLKI